MLLPAPFSPNNAWISPASIVRSTSSLATTPGKRFTIFLMSNGGILDLFLTTKLGASYLARFSRDVGYHES